MPNWCPAIKNNGDYALCVQRNVSRKLFPQRFLSRIFQILSAQQLIVSNSDKVIIGSKQPGSFSRREVRSHAIAGGANCKS